MSKPYKPSYRHWVKLWTAGWFDGTCRFELSMAQRAIWVDLLVMAAQSRTPGVICSGVTGGVLQPYPYAWLASKIRCSEQELKDALTMFLYQGRLSESPLGVYHITSWEKYQSEYQRQKPSREKRVNLSPSVSNSDSVESAHQSDRQEEEGEGDERGKTETQTKEEESDPVAPARRGGDADSGWGAVLPCQPVLDAFHRAYPVSHVGPNALRSITDFVAQLSLGVVTESMDQACKHTSTNPPEAFRYFCGICWQKIKRSNQPAGLLD